MQYDANLIQPFRDEMTRMGFRELRTPEDVDNAVAQPGTHFIVVNSVCGCAAGKARPAISMALRQSSYMPDGLATVFAGGDIEATARLRKHLGPLPPSSPSMALYKDGRLVHFVPRYQIESRQAVQIAQYLIEVFEEHCQPESRGAGEAPPR